LLDGGTNLESAAMEALISALRRSNQALWCVGGSWVSRGTIEAVWRTRVPPRRVSRRPS
jgi:hypothetical protein